MTTAKLVSIWVLFFATTFVLGYFVTHMVISTVMADLVIEYPTGYTTLEVKPVPNEALQTNQYTPIQGAVNPIGKQL